MASDGFAEVFDEFKSIMNEMERYNAAGGDEERELDNGGRSIVIHEADIMGETAGEREKEAEMAMGKASHWRGARMRTPFKK